MKKYYADFVFALLSFLVICIGLGLFYVWYTDLNESDFEDRFFNNSEWECIEWENVTCMKSKYNISGLQMCFLENDDRCDFIEVNKTICKDNRYYLVRINEKWR